MPLPMATVNLRCGTNAAGVAPNPNQRLSPLCHRGDVFLTVRQSVVVDIAERRAITSRFRRQSRCANLARDMAVRAVGKGETKMVKFSTILRRAMLGGAAALALGFGLQPGVEANAANGKRICVSWRHFQEERWRIDEAGIKSVLGPAGYAYVSADAQGDPQKQMTDVDSLLSSKCDAAIILAQDSKAIIPAVAQAKAAGVPVIAYDVPVDSPDVTFISFDNVAVGRAMAEGMVKTKNSGNWALIEGDAAMTIINLFRDGQMEVLKPLIDKGQIKVVAKQNIENWKPDLAQAAMEQILTQTNNKVDAVLSMNDGMATGVAAALASQKMLGIPLSGQDGDKAALNRIAKGQQTVSVWKNSYNLGQAAAKAAVEMAEGKPVTGTKPFKTESGQTQPSVLLTPIGITRDNLNLVVDGKWISKAELCDGVTENPPPACK
jgi:D-xylose transport system substrate-binding protein